MSKEGAQQFLKFGQIIRIHGHKCIQKEESEKVQKRGMIAVKGFTELDARYITFNKFKNCQFYRQTLFQVLPKGAFEKTQTLQAKKRQEDAYKELIKMKMGDHIKFGQDIIFKHVDSQAYLSGSVRCSEGGLGAFKVELSSELSTNLVFRLYPFRSFEKEGDKIKLQSPLRIKNISNRCYVSTEKNQQKYNIVTTYSQSFTWLIHLHEGHETLSDLDTIRTHDIIFLTHTKNQGYLCLDGKHESRAPCIKLPLEQTGFPCFTCLWEIQKWSIPEISPYPDTELGTDGTYSLRDILSGQYLQVYKLQQLEKIRIGANNVSSVDSRQISIKSAKGLTLASQYMKNKGLIKICGPKAQKTEGQLDADNAQIKFEDEYNYREQSNYYINPAKYTDVESQHGFRIIKIDEDSKRQVLFMLSTYQILNQFAKDLEQTTQQYEKKTQSKKIENIYQTLSKLIAFIKNCKQSQIENDILPDKKKQYISKDLEICPIIFRILQQMGKKILDEIYKDKKQQNQIFKNVFNRAYYLILQIIKSNPMTKLYVCQSWLDIILDHAIQNQQENVHQTLNEILQSNELVVRKFLKANNDHLVHRIINIFTLKPPHQKFLNIFRAACMSNNLPIVQNQNLILREFFKKLDNVARFFFIKKVKQFYDGSGNRVVEEDKKIYLHCCISKDHEQTRSLKAFYEESKRLDLSQTANYFTAYLNLLADICYGRNTEARKYVQEILAPQRQGKHMDPSLNQLIALDTLIGILQDQQIKSLKQGATNLLRATLRVITYAFVQSADQNPVLRINRYRNLDNMAKNRKQIQERFKKVMDFIKQKLSGFQSFYKQKTKIDGIQEKQFYLTMLQLLKSTLTIGYWSVEQQQKYLLPLLLKLLRNEKKDILHGKEDEISQFQKQLQQFKRFKEQASMYTPSVQLITQCKALACELIEIIFDFRHDNMVTKCAQVYKDMMAVAEASKEKAADNSKISSLLQSKKNKQPAKNKFYDHKIWQEYLKKIFEPDEGSQADKQGVKNMNALMAQLSIHRNPHLFFRSLTILKRHFEFRVDIFKLFLNMSIYDDKNGGPLASQINKRRSVLNKLEEENLLYAKISGVYNDVMSFLVWLSQTLKMDTSISNQPRFQNFKTIFQHFNERSLINKFHQRLIKNIDLHPVLLKFLGLSRLPLSNFSQDARMVLKYIYRFLTLLVKSFKQAKMEVLPLLERIKSHANQEAEGLQQDRISDEDNDVHSIQKRDDCQAIQLLIEMFSHNKKILYNQGYIQQTLLQFTELVNRVSIYHYYKSHLLNFFRSFIYYNDKHIKVNQSRILAKLQDSKKTKIFYRDDPKEQNSLNVQLIKQLIKEWEADNSRLIQLAIPARQNSLGPGQYYPVVISARLTYFIVLFNLFANLVEGQHTVNIGKCQQVHSYDMLMKILKSGSICYPLKTHLRNYINQLYYSTGVQEDLCQPIIKNQIPLIIQDLNKIIVIICKQVEGHYYIAHPIRFKYFQTYFYLYVEQIVFTLNYLFHDHNFNKALTQELNKNYSRGHYFLHYYVIRIYERLRWIVSRFYQYRYLRNFINKVTNKMKKQYLQKFRQSSFRIFDRNQEKNHDPNSENFNLNEPKPKNQINQVRVLALKRRSKNLLHKLVKGQISNYFKFSRQEKDNNFPLTFVLPYQDEAEQIADAGQMAEKKHHQQQLNKLAEKLKILLFSHQDASSKKDFHHLKLQKLNDELMIRNYQFIEFMVKYEEHQCQQLYNINDYSKEYYRFKGVFVSFEEYIRIFVKVNTEKPSSIPNNLKIFFYKVLLQYIRRFKTKEKLKPLQLWEKEDYQGYQKQIKQNQNFLKSSNVAQLLIQSLKVCDDIHLFSSIMHFGIAFVLLGNHDCQNAILQKLYEDRKNQVFLKLQKEISRLGKKITSRIHQQIFRKIPMKEEFIVQSLDLYDYYDKNLKVMRKVITLQIDPKQESYQQQIDCQVFKRIFRFLQFLCQQNNIKAKEFVRQQVDTQNKKNNYSFSLINTTTFEIRRLFKTMNSEACILIMPLIEFLNEVVTIPVVENQRALCETTFFQDLCYMATFFKVQQNLIQRGFDNNEKKDKLYDIYHKCITIILNILEGNHSDMYRELMLKLDVAFLLGIIERNLKAKQIMKVEDFKKYLYDEDKQQQYVPKQIQIAMNVNIVIEKLKSWEGSQKFTEKLNIKIIDIEKSNNYPIGQLIKILTKQLNKIQVISSQGKQLIYFPNHPILTKLSGQTRDRIMNAVQRTTQRQKIRSLFSYRKDVSSQIQINFKLEKEKYLGLSFQPSKIQKLKQWGFTLTHFINIFWFITTDVIVQYTEVIYQVPALFVPFLFGLDIVQLTIIFIYFCCYFKCKYQLAEFQANKASGKDQQKDQGFDGNALIQYAERIKRQQQMSKAQKLARKIMDFVKGFIFAILGFIYNTKLMILLRYDDKFSFVLGYLIVSIIGTFMSQSIFLLYMVFFFMQNDTLSNVFNAISYNIKQLLSVSLLGIVFVYIFSLMFYSTYALDTIKNSQSGETCDTIIDCVMDLYVSGTIGGSVEHFQILRFATDLTWFVFFGLLFGNIVSGIMIDTFAQLRSQRQAMQDDKKNMCYMCGNNRGNLQKNNENFDDHIREKHFLWNYTFYMYCLTKKDSNYYSGLEYEIQDCLSKGPQDENYIKWIPFQSQAGDDGHGDKIIALTEKMTELNKSSQQRLQAYKQRVKQAMSGGSQQGPAE